MSKNLIHDDEKHLVLDHDYDGIQELNNPLPKWWQATFYITILFSIPYGVYFWFLGGPTLEDEFVAEYSEIKKIRNSYLEQLSEFNEETYSATASSPEMINQGKDLFNLHCVACHAPMGAGDIGPNLTDKFWLYAEGTAETIFPFVLEGNPTGGMPAWGLVLQEDELYSITSYIMSIQGMEHENPKDPQGEEYP